VAGIYPLRLNYRLLREAEALLKLQQQQDLLQKDHREPLAERLYHQNLLAFQARLLARLQEQELL
jgi:hypothetical protein